MNNQERAPQGHGGKSASSRPYLIAITGSIASGKSLVGQFLKDAGVFVLDTDEIAHNLLSSPNQAYQAVLDRFGADLVDGPGGPINREKLGNIVFADKKANDDLKAILHPAIKAATQAEIDRHRDRELIVVQVPLLFESKLEAEYDEVWTVLVDRKVQVERLKARNNKLTDEQAEARIAAQWPQEKKAARSHRIIDNSGAKEETMEQVRKCLAAARASAQKAEPAAAAGDPLRNERYREFLRRGAELAATDALARMGDVSTTQHKQADASVRGEMHTCEQHDDGSCSCHDSELLVRVLMCVKNRQGDCAGHQPGQCSCGCAGNCKAGCACQPGCGCQCQPPCPPTPPAPPPPPPNRLPCPSPCEGIAAMFFGFLAFLAVLAALVAIVWLRPWEHHGPPVKPPCLWQCRPVVVCPPSGCEQPKPPVTPPVVIPPSPPAPIPPPHPTCPSGTTRSADPPSFVLPYLHNQVRGRVTEYTVTYAPNCQGATVVGTDINGRLVNIEEYGPNLAFSQQWIVNYSQFGDAVWVDLFTAPNVFVGRTMYEYDSGRLMRVRLLDGHQRPIIIATYERNPDGSLCAVVVQRYNQFGVVVDVQRMSPSGIGTIAGDFYMFDRFGQAS